MQMLPYEHFTFQTTLRIQDVVTKLKDAIEPRQLVRVSHERRRGQKLYEGKVEGDDFSAYPLTSYQKSFVPVIQGKITQAMGGCSITITLRPNTVLLLFMALWVGSLGFAFLSALWRVVESVLIQAAPPLLQLVISGSMLILGYGLLNASYQKEAERSKSFFRRLLDESYIEEDPIELFDED